MISLLLLVACWSDTTETTIRMEGFGDDELSCSKGDGASCVAAAQTAQRKGDAVSASLYSGLGCNHDSADACALASALAQESGEPERALAYGRKACALGQARGCNYYGTLLLDGGDGPGAIAAFESACAGSDAAGCGNLGMVQFAGEVVPKDVPAATAMWEKACVGGEVQSCHNLGVVYLNGLEGVTKDPTLGDRYLTRGCELEYARSCADLSVALTSGKNLPVDAQRAADLAAKACKLGDGASCR